MKKTVLFIVLLAGVVFAQAHSAKLSPRQESIWYVSAIFPPAR